MMNQSRRRLSRRHRHLKRRTIYGTPSRFNRRRRWERTPTSWNGCSGNAPNVTFSGRPIRAEAIAAYIEEF